jgi:translation initiation factor 1 (eIF-1/SUI1)
VPIDYRYHIGSFVAIFVALLLGILVGIGLAPDPAYIKQAVADLKKEFTKKDAELEALRQEKNEHEALAKEAVAGVIRNRLQGRRVAIILDHDFGRDDVVPNLLRALMKQSGATLASTTTITKDFVALQEPLHQKVVERFNLYPPPGVHLRSLIAETLAKDLAQGKGDSMLEMQSLGLVKSSADSDYKLPVDSVLFVGGAPPGSEASPERIDLPMIAELTSLGVRVVGCESSRASSSSIPLYKSKGISTVDNADMLAGRMAVVLCLAGAKGHFGVKDTADRFLPAMSTTDHS